MSFIALLCIITGVGMLAFGYQKAIKNEYALMRLYREGKCGKKEAKISGVLQLVFGLLNSVFAILFFISESKIIFYICSIVLCLTAVVFAAVYAMIKKR